MELFEKSLSGDLEFYLNMSNILILTVIVLITSNESLSKSLENVEDTKKYIQDGRGSLFSKANKMKELGANTKESIK